MGPNLERLLFSLDRYFDFHRISGSSSNSDFSVFVGVYPSPELAIQVVYVTVSWVRLVAKAVSVAYRMQCLDSAASGKRPAVVGEIAYRMN